MSIDGPTLVKTGVSALAIIAGVNLKNSAKKLKLPGCEKNLGTGLFIAGWTGMAYALKGTSWDMKTIIAFIAVIFIVIAVMSMIHTMETGEKVPMILPFIFAVAWMVLGLSLGILRDGRYDKWSAAAGALASVMVIISMLVVLPWQRDNCLVDGPGFPMFTAAFAIITLVNSLNGGVSSLM